jgi:hypothetical protein
MWKIIAQPDRPQMTVLHMRIAWWITKVTDTHSEYVIITAFRRQQWLSERASMLRYTYIVSLVIRIRRTISAFRFLKALLQVADVGCKSQIAAESVQKEEEPIIL